MRATETPSFDGPYKGLVPYTEEDARFFFGREIEREIIISNLRGSRLTLLYGASGVGKSSVLQAGVAHRLWRLASQNLEEDGSPELAVALFSSWRDHPVRGLLGAAEDAVRRLLGPEKAISPPPPSDLVSTLRFWTEQVKGDLLLILDQFEEYFLYHPNENGKGSFTEEFAQAVNDPALRVNFLLSLREDALARLDHFKGYIPTLFDNYLRLQHLDRKAAEAAIRKPVEEYSRLLPSETKITVEPELVEQVLNQIVVGRLAVGEIGQGKPNLQSPPGEERIETPFLQLVMSRIWEKEQLSQSRKLRVSTLEDLGGAESIVQTHLDSTLEKFSPDARATVAAIFRYLVTPRGTKIALAATDLAEFTNLHQERIETNLQRLSQPDTRILRKDTGPSGTSRYEIFHDVLGPAILDWRRRFLRKAEEAAAQGRLKDEQRRTIRWMLGAIGLAVLLVAFLLQSIWAFKQKERAEEQARLATASRLANLAQDFADERLDLGLLLSAHAHQILDSFDTRNILLSLVQTNPRLTKFLHSHSSPVRSIGFVDDNKTLVSIDDRGVVSISNIATPSQPTKLFTIRADVRRSQISPDGKILAIVTDDSLDLWNLVSRKLTTSLSLRGFYGPTIAFSPDSGIIAIRPFELAASPPGSSPQILCLWNWRENRTCREINRDPPDLLAGTGILAFSPDGKLLALADLYSIRIWDVTQSKLLETIPSYLPAQKTQRDIRSIKFGPNSQILASGDTQGTVLLWDVPNKRYSGNSINIPYTTITHLAFSHDGETLFSACNDDTIKLWSIDNRAPLTSPPNRYARSQQIELQVNSRPHRLSIFAISPNGEILATGSSDGSIRLWSLNDSQPLEFPFKDSQNSPIVSLETLPDLKTFATGGEDGTISLWDFRSRRVVSSAKSSSKIARIAVSYDGKKLVTAEDPDDYGWDNGWDDTLRLWHIVDQKIRYSTFISDEIDVGALTFHPHRYTLAYSDHNSIFLSDLASAIPNQEATIDIPEDRILRLDFSPSGKIFAASSLDGKIYIGDILSRDITDKPISLYKDPVLAIAFSPDGKVLASSDIYGRLALWDPKTLRALSGPIAGKFETMKIVFGQDSTLVAGSESGLQLWDVIHRQPLSTILVPNIGAITDFAYGPGLNQLIASGTDGTLHLWDLDPKSWRDLACRRANRNLSLTEWRQHVGLEIPYQCTCPELLPGEGAPRECPS